MKQAHSTKWKGSTQPRKQRKYVYNLPDHLLGSQLKSHLSKSLRGKHGIRTLRVRVGDKIKVLRGTHKGKEGKVERVDTKNARLIVTKIESTKKQGGSAPYPLRPSNCQLIELAEEKRRLKRKKQTTLGKTVSKTAKESVAKESVAKESVAKESVAKETPKTTEKQQSVESATAKTMKTPAQSAAKPKD